jgi:hypothetical protein
MSKFVETLQNFSTHFESLGMRGDLSGRAMLTELSQKLPGHHEKSENSITGLVSWLHSHLIQLQKAKAPAELLLGIYNVSMIRRKSVRYTRKIQVIS